MALTGTFASLTANAKRANPNIAFGASALSATETKLFNPTNPNVAAPKEPAPALINCKTLSPSIVSHGSCSVFS